MMRRRAQILLITVVVAVVIPYLKYRDMIGQNNKYASLLEYPNPASIAKNLGCFDPDESDRAASDFLGGDNSSTTLVDVEAAAFQPPLYARSRFIVDATGRRAKLASVNWYGASDKRFVPGGLDVRHRRDIARTIRKMGFNTVRLPYSDEMVMVNPLVPESEWFANQDLLDWKENMTTETAGNVSTKGTSYSSSPRGTLTALEIFQAVVEALTSEGVGVIINNHITQARWCCDLNPCDASWSNSHLGPFCPVVLTEKAWLDNWQTIVEPHLDNPLVIGMDLRNEVRSPLGKMAWNSWATAAEKAGNRLLNMQPDWLIFVEGVGSSNFLQGAHPSRRPVKLSVDEKLVYSAHVYGWSGWGSVGDGPYWSRPYESFATDMYDNWGFLLEEGIAPVWVGEFGCPQYPKEGDLHYWRNLIRYLDEMDADFGYWAVNPRKPNAAESLETYSLLEDDWRTPKCDYRLHDLAVLREEKG